jgi:LacI family gluconate utilization system Gnt-I transcriptional repressor
MDLTADPIDQVIGFSHVAAGRRMTEHLIAQGYQRIAFLKGWTSKRGGGRYIGYLEALSAAGMEEPLAANTTRANAGAEDGEHVGVPVGRHMPEFASAGIGRELLREALAVDPKIDAVFCNNDIIALGALFECIARGIRVPEDMGISGFNDHEYMAAAEPALSSARTPRYASGYEAVLAIRRELNGEPIKQRVRDLGVEIMARTSTDRRRVAPAPGTGSAAPDWATTTARGGGPGRR